MSGESTLAQATSRGWQLAVPVEDSFDVVPVRVNDERCVIPGVVMRAKTRRAVVAAAGFDSGAVELVNGGSVGCGEGHMNGSGRGFPFPDPESPPPSMANPGPCELSTTFTPNGSRACS